MSTDENHLRDLPEPADLHARFSRDYAVDWGDRVPTAAGIADTYGARATAKSLRQLQTSADVEPAVTAAFLAAVPPGSRAYQLDSRVKSPASLARKIRDAEKKERRAPLDDILRYTVLSRTPDDVVPAAEAAVAGLRRAGWRMSFAVNSYAEGSRYKGLHAGLIDPSGHRVEVQFHSVESVEAKEATTPAYETERSATASGEERARARAYCVAISDRLAAPAGLAQLGTLGGVRVAVRNYSDSRAESPGPIQDREQLAARRQTRSGPAVDRAEEITR